MKERIAELQTRTKKFALRIITLYSSLPKKAEAQVIGKQLLRPGTSVGANYREAFRARSNAEFAAKAGICLSELEETSYWMELLIEVNIVPVTKVRITFG
jgi:four helix bundle protein